MKIRENEKMNYQSWREKNSDPYSRRCFTYAEEWAELLEKRIPETASDPEVMRIIVDHAKEDSHAADTDGITGFMYGAAVSILAQAWIHGELLRRWHNLDTQLSDEGEKANREGGVLNPALLRLG